MPPSRADKSHRRLAVILSADLKWRASRTNVSLLHEHPYISTHRTVSVSLGASTINCVLEKVLDAGSNNRMYYFFQGAFRLTCRGVN